MTNHNAPTPTTDTPPTTREQLARIIADLTNLHNQLPH